MSKGFVTVDGIPVEINGEKNLLEIVRKIGVRLPTFCYHTELSIYGACRMCMVEDERGNLEAACSTPPRNGMVIRTNTERLRKYRKMILELLLANHCRDCTTCQNNGACKLQTLAMRLGVDRVRFPNAAEHPKLDESSVCITRDFHKCILCGDCVRMCNEVQNVGAIDFARRGAKMTISTAFDVPIAQSPCVGCGQCAAVCPTGAIVVKSDTAPVWAALANSGVKVTVQVAPAVRVAMGRELGLDGSNTLGQVTAALRQMGFDEVYDTATGADLTVMEESAELLRRLEEGPQTIPLFTSCCPGWVQFCEKNYPELMPHVSTCRSPMEMFASVLKVSPTEDQRPHIHVAIMPCTAKKFEAAREELQVEGAPGVDYVITTQELIQMIKESGIQFQELAPEAMDMPFAYKTGAGVIFGVSGGVTEAVLRKLSADKSLTGLKFLAFQGVRGLEGIKECTVPYGDRELKIAVVSGLGNASTLIQRIKAGEHYDFVEVMACPNGCISGGGQPFAHLEEQVSRGKGLYTVDQISRIKRSENNPVVTELYQNLLKDRAHELLHVEYAGVSK